MGTFKLQVALHFFRGHVCSISVVCFHLFNHILLLWSKALVQQGTTSEFYYSFSAWRDGDYIVAVGLERMQWWGWTCFKINKTITWCSAIWHYYYYAASHVGAIFICFYKFYMKMPVCRVNIWGSWAGSTIVGRLMGTRMMIVVQKIKAVQKN